MENNDIDWYSNSNLAIMGLVGSFLRESRLQLNKSQGAIADAAGIHRSTLVRLEKGEGGTLLSFIEVLRELNQLQLLQVFETKNQISPIQLAKLEMQKRRRATTTNQISKKKDKSDW